MVFVISQVVGVFALLAYSFSFWQKDRRKILLLEVCECFLYAIHYFLIGATTGALINIIGMARSGSFIYKDKNKFMSTNALPIIFLCIYVLNAILTWEGLISIFPTLGSMILCLTIWQHNTKSIRKYGVLVQSLWLVYAFYVGSYVAIISEFIILISTIVAIIKLDILKDKKPKYKILMNVNLPALEKIYDSSNQNFVYDKQAIKNSEYIKFVCLKGNKSLGYIAIYPHADFMEKQGFPKNETVNDFSVFIWHIVVRNEYQRKGVATALLQEVEKVYKGYEIYSVLDSRNNPSINFHTTNNFVKKSDFERVYFGKLQKFDVMQLKSSIKEVPPTIITINPSESPVQEKSEKETAQGK